MVSAQLAVAGVQTHGAQRSERHDCPLGHALVAASLPCALQTRACPVSTQLDAPGVHTCATQVASAPQNCPVLQSVSATQSTQCPRVVSHT